MATLAEGVMPIQMLTRVDDPTSVYDFNESRIGLIASAKSLHEATYMGLWDLFKDHFAGGAKRAAAERLYYSLPRLGLDPTPKDVFERFQELKAHAIQERQAEFRTEVTGLGADDGRWQFRFMIGNTEILKSARLQNSPGQYHKEFALLQSLEQNQLTADALRHNKDLISPIIRDMTGGDAEDGWTIALLDDAIYSKENFSEIKSLGNGLFLAVFRAPRQKEVEGKEEVSSSSSFGDRSGVFRREVAAGKEEEGEDVSSSSSRLRRRLRSVSVLGER
jgi:hypothetical protein